MQQRTESEIKAYVDGFNACYKQFSDLINTIIYNKNYPPDASDVLEKGMYHMEILKSAVNGVVKGGE